MRAFSKHLIRAAVASAFIFLFAAAAFAQTQATAADLSGTVTDPNGAVVAGATITASQKGTGLTRTVQTGSDGSYRLIGLPPGSYEITAEAATFKKVVISDVVLTVGQNANLPIGMEIGEQDVIVNISGDSVELIESGRTTVANTIDQTRIENLPINERSATGFALTLSTIGRDNGRPIGPAPTSGLNVGGQRGRSTLIQVDGADFTDNSINAARTTVSQEAVQEYQVSTNSYAAEFGRATGGVVNVVTKRGTNELSGNVFGFLRDKELQARYPFAPVEKPAFTRGQYGITLGGPIVKDKTFIFAAFEGRQRRESGYFTSDVTRNLSGSITLGSPILPFTQTFDRLTPEQVSYAQSLIGTGNPAAINAAVQYLYLASSGGNTGLTGTNPLISAGGAIPVGQVVGPRFFLSGAPVPYGTTDGEGNLIAFQPLLGIEKVFPVKDKSHFFTVRGDHSFNDSNQLTLRFGYNPGYTSGIQVESQNQSLGQNAYSRTGITRLKDTSFSAGLNSSLSATVLNEFRFNFGRRKTSFRSANNDAVAFNISDTAFIGRELFSPVERTETRYQLTDNVTILSGNHTFKFGGDISFIDLPKAVFELNFAGLFNFGPFAATNLAAFPQAPNGQTAPDMTPVQSYGLGLPSTYIQGFGDPVSQIKNKPLAVFAQDSWKVTPRLTLNFGVRYDIEFTETIAPVGFADPLSGIVLSEADILAAQDALGVQQGFPVDSNNIAPRFGFAWDVFGSGKTVVRGAAGIFYDHPLLAVAFNSDIADASQQQQAVLTAGSPSPTALLNAAQVFQGTVCVPGAPLTPVCAALPPGTFTPGVAPSANYQFGRQRFDDQTFPGFGTVLPFTLPVDKNFQYASAFQASLGVEQQIGRDMSLSVNFLHVGAHHLPHPTDSNTPRTDLQIENFRRFYGGALPETTTQALAFSIPTTAPGTTAGVGCFVVIPGMVAQCPNGRVVAPAIANFFRPSGPNYFLATALSGGAVTKAVLDSQLAGSLRSTGVISPFGAVNTQISDGNSSYNALNVELKRRFSNNFQFLAGYTWSHSMDDSSDLQTLLIPQTPSNLKAEWANSLFDQRHRFVFSGVVTSPTGWRRSDSLLKKVFADFTVAPIIEISSGRPFNIITNFDANNDQSSQTDRPDVMSDGTLCIPSLPVSSGTPAGAPCSLFDFDENGNMVFGVGSLGRNRGITGSYASVDMRLTRAFHLNERVRFDLILEGFNLFNRFNEASVAPFFDAVNNTGVIKNGSYRSRATAAFDQRQFQIGMKVSF
jgi:outer membrane receptor protein involved in Fe transport